MTYIRIKLSNGEVVDAEFIEFVGIAVEKIAGCYGARIGSDDSGGNDGDNGDGGEVPWSEPGDPSEPESGG